jgi:hypothetical protein
MDRAHEMWEREAREEMYAERRETFLRHAPRGPYHCDGCGDERYDVAIYVGADLCADCISEMETT